MEKSYLIYILIGVLILGISTLSFLAGIQFNKDHGTSLITGYSTSPICPECNCPSCECVKSSITAPYDVKIIALSGKGPSLFAGNVEPEIIVTNTNEEPISIILTFNCEDLFDHTKDRKVGPINEWILPHESKNIKGNYHVGKKENWQCTYDIVSSQLTDCTLTQTQ